MQAGRRGTCESISSRSRGMTISRLETQRTATMVSDSGVRLSWGVKEDGNADKSVPGYLALSNSPDVSWAKNDDLAGTKILKEMARLTGQDPSKVAELVNRDI